METEGRAGDDERTARLAQLEAMRTRGEDPYPVRFDRTHTLTEDLRTHTNLADYHEPVDPFRQF